MNRACCLVALGLALVTTGCAHDSGRVRVAVAVAPVDTLGVPAAEGDAFHRSLLRELSSSSSARPTATSPRAELGRCRESDDCLAKLGRRAAASLVLSSTLAGLGDMRLVRARLVRSSDALVVQDLQETIPGGGASLEQRAGDLVKRLFPESGGRSWYRRWWVWATVAGVVGTTVGLTVWAATRSPSGGPLDPTTIHVGDL